MTNTCSWWDPFDAEFIADPYPTYEKLRAMAPVLWHEPLHSWVITAHETCQSILCDWDTFASDFRRVGDDEPPESVSIQTLDPPEHRAVHQLLAQGLQAQDMTRLARAAREQVDEHLAKLAAVGGDFVTDVSIPVSISMSLGLLGVPQADSAHLAELSAAVVMSMNSGLRPETELAGNAARKELSQMIGSWMRHPSGDGLISFISACGGHPFTSGLAIENSLRVLLLAGINSAQRMLGLTLLTALRENCAHEHVFGSRLDAPDEISVSRLSHEFVRYDNPFQAQSRKCTRAAEIAGVNLRRGDTVTLLFGAANRDPGRFGDPERFIPHRHPNPHLGFGRGVHACLGASAALCLLRVTIEALTSCCSVFTLTGPPEFDQNPTLRGLTSLPVKPAGC
jgi:cytochrome P450